jgi:hypothetical protein
MIEIMCLQVDFSLEVRNCRAARLRPGAPSGTLCLGDVIGGIGLDAVSIRRAALSASFVVTVKAVMSMSTRSADTISRSYVQA